jgi:acyl carrier protein
MPQASDPIAAGVIDVIKNVSRRPVEPVLASELVADLGFDSLAALELVAELEDRFDISMPATGIPAAATVADVVDAVARLAAGGAAPR